MMKDFFFRAAILVVWLFAIYGLGRLGWDAYRSQTVWIPEKDGAFQISDQKANQQILTMNAQGMVGINVPALYEAWKKNQQLEKANQAKKK